MKHKINASTDLSLKLQRPLWESVNLLNLKFIMVLQSPLRLVNFD